AMLPENIQQIKAEENLIADVTVKTIPNEDRRGIVASGGSKLNIRAQPSVNGRIIGQVNDKSIITVCENNSDWYLVKFNGITGYVMTKYISIK
ncbi:SH3 domain-containing protein, partial [Candidatus Nomurabacteria bacterium]|nr:SH3 domain-containing protein [Candidatus Nomurabacteria bacterium]